MVNHVWPLAMTVVAFAATAASFTADLTIQQCTQSGCTPVQKRVALDSTSNGTESLIMANGTTLKLSYGGAKLGGPRVYLIEEDGTNKNTMFMLKNQEFTFDVELSTMPCGFNAALYFVGMDANEGGAEDGTKYCDAQAVDGTFCSEMDIMEANTEAQQFTTHACIDACGSYTSGVKQCAGNGSPSTVCDQNGCGLNPFRYGPGTTYDTETNNVGWYGHGADRQLDSTQLYTAVTQFHTDAGTGDLANVSRFYLQNGKRIGLPTLYVVTPTDGKHMGGLTAPSLTKEFCGFIYDRWNGDAQYTPLAQMGKNMEAGMVLAMSAWYAQETYTDGKPQGTQTGMSWLDGTNNWGKYIKAGPCDVTTSQDAGPYHATFSNIKIGDIGTTTGGGPPSPSPPSPPAPPSGQHVCADPGSTPACNVCSACCHSYIPAADCDKCVKESC